VGAVRQTSAAPKRLIAAAAAAAASDSKSKNKKPHESKSAVKGRQFAGLPYLTELTQKTVSVYDSAGRAYYLYTNKTFPTLFEERGSGAASDDEVVFVVLLPLGITRKFPAFDFPDAAIGDTMHFEDEKKVFSGTVSFTMFPPKDHATGFIHLRGLKAVDKQQRQQPPPPQVAAAGPAASR